MQYFKKSSQLTVAFATAITVAITGAMGVTDNTVITLNDVTGFTVHA